MFSQANQPLHVIAALQEKTSCYPLLCFLARAHLCGKQLSSKQHQAKILWCVGAVGSRMPGLFIKTQQKSFFNQNLSVVHKLSLAVYNNFRYIVRI